MTSVADAGMVVTAVVVVVAAEAAPFVSAEDEAGAVFSKEGPVGTREEREAAPGGFGAVCKWAVLVLQGAMGFIHLLNSAQGI